MVGESINLRRSVMARTLVFLAALSVVAASIPAALDAQTEPTETNVSTKFIMTADSKSGGVWRLNSNTGELWFCLASAAPKCHRAEDTKQ
jgi:hypothetical protein